MEKKILVATILEFLSQIGISVQESDFQESTFLPGLLIDRGTLFYDYQKLENPGDLLHEAGHIALMTPEERPVIVGDVKKYRLPTQDDEMGVMAWTFAAAKYLGLDPEVVFHQNGYHGQSQELIFGFESGHTLGVPLLVWMQLCDYETFPQMKKWVRE